MKPEVTTYRYVRLGLLALLLALAIAIGIETVSDGWKASISAYYYTPAGPVFVAVMASVGVCLVALQGFTDAENVCLNLAGISAPMVAFVPSPERGESPDVAAITNNAATYLSVLAVGYLVVLAFVWHRVRRGGTVSVWSRIGLGSVALAWLVGVVWLLSDRSSFVARAHTLAATFTLLPFVFVVALNTDWGVRFIAREPVPSRTRFGRAYWVVLAGMFCVAIVFGVLHTWAYALLGLEIGVLVLFAAFWVLQSVDLIDPARDELTSDAARSARNAAPGGSGPSPR